MTGASKSCSFNKPKKGTGEGSSTWYMQRVASIGLIWLSLWFVKFCLALMVDTQEEMLDLFQNPYHATSLVLFLTLAFHHGWLGTEEVIEDYVHCSCVKGFLRIVTFFTFLFFYAYGVLTAIKLFIS